MRPVAGLSLELIATSGPIPLSANNGIALISPDTACIFDSYEIQVVCGDRKWERPLRMGRPGGGPRELGAYGTLTRGPGSSVAFFDGVHRRVSIFGMGGSFAERRLPTIATPASVIRSDSTIVAHGYPAPGNAGVLRLTWMSRTTGEADSTLELRFDPGTLGEASAIVSAAVLSPAGTYIALVRAGGRQYLARYSSAGEPASLLDLPRVDVVYPAEADVEEYVAGFTRALLGRQPPDSTVEAFRQRPLSRLPRNTLLHTVQFDSAGRIWVLNNRRVAGRTSVDVFRDSAYLGTVELRGRVLAIQIAGSILVALRDAAPGEAMSISEIESGRRLDWYEIHDDCVTPPCGR